METTRHPFKTPPAYPTVSSFCIHLTQFYVIDSHNKVPPLSWAKVTSCLILVPNSEKCLVRQSSLQEEIGLKNSKERLPETIRKRNNKKKKKHSKRMEQRGADCKIHSRCFSQQSDLQTISSNPVSNCHFHFFPHA